jgi:uncharacterized protein YdeI (YjbR/CyaY-like superfamily)
MKIGKIIYFKNRNQFAKWLRQYHDKKEYLWLLFYKKHTKKPSMIINEAVEEALRYGWIDGILKRIDNEKHVIRFSPRRQSSCWSKHNINRIIKMFKLGKMRKPGIDKLPKALLNKLKKDNKHFKIPKNRKLSNKFGVKIY